ncbi:MAG: aldo/keto reductase [Lewinellaceae bacterium]|nr:aldo/keto reductase [Lewinellaceae bacterium]
MSYLLPPTLHYHALPPLRPQWPPAARHFPWPVAQLLAVWTFMSTIGKLFFWPSMPGITHFDLANNYGPPPGSAEENFGRILHADFRNHRDEMIISTKAGYRMWDGLRRMGLQKIPNFQPGPEPAAHATRLCRYLLLHRPDPDTPMEETMMALDQVVRQGKALYAGISNYNAEQSAEAFEILRRLGTPCLIHQPLYSMFVRDPEAGLLEVLEKEGVGCIPFSPLAQGLLTAKYLKGIPEDSRAAKPHGFLQESAVTPQRLTQIKALNDIAMARHQSLAQMALSWLLKDPRVTSVLVGASRPEQLADSLKCLGNIHFEGHELEAIEAILKN